MKNSITIVACGRRKAEAPARASELYVSGLSRASANWARALGNPWFILSALHGLLDPDDVIDPYDVALSKLDTNQIATLRAKISRQVEERIGPVGQVTVLGGSDYSRLARQVFPNANVSEPLSGLSLGWRTHWLKSTAGWPSEAIQLERFYEHLRQLASGPLDERSLPTLAEYLKGPVPEAGVYFFFEDGEQRAGRRELRVTRVGTHRVSLGSRSTLRSRLRTHAGTDQMDGSHRSSVFRLHVGNALLHESSKDFESARPTWGTGSGRTASKEIREAERGLEREVSRRIQSMRLLVLPISDTSSSTSDRAYVEQSSIALLASKGSVLDPPSPTWLGRASSAPSVRSSGLWNVNHVDQSVHPDFVEVWLKILELFGSRGEEFPSMAPHGWRADVHSVDRLF